MLLKIALRNVLRNKRRTALNILMIVACFCSIVVFRGFSQRLILNLEEVAIDTQFGHYQIATEGHWKRDPKLRWEEKMLSLSDPSIQEITKHPMISYLSGRINFFSLLSTQKTALSVAIQAFEPNKEERLMSTIYMKEGKNLSGKNPFEIIIGAGVQENLQATSDSLITLVGQTVFGSVNAIDVEFRGVFQSGISEFDNNTVMIPLEAAQILLDTEDVDRAYILLNDNRNYNIVRDELETILKPSDELSLRGWRELADLHRDTEEYFRVQNRIIEGILLALIFLAILNTVSMSVFERTGEIGTTRALGDKRSDVITQFLLEGGLLALIGIIVAIPSSILFSLTMNALQVPITIPGASVPLEVDIMILPWAYLYAGFIVIVTTIISSLGPASKASRQNIVTALRQNI